MSGKKNGCKLCGLVKPKLHLHHKYGPICDDCWDLLDEQDESDFILRGSDTDGSFGELDFEHQEDTTESSRFEDVDINEEDWE